jgi:hypothetical protein
MTCHEDFETVSSADETLPALRANARRPIPCFSLLGTVGNFSAGPDLSSRNPAVSFEDSQPKKG